MKTFQFQSLWDSHQQQLKHFIFANVKNKSAAEDILQETYIQAFVHFERLKEKEKFRAWIYAISRNFIHRHFREKNKFQVATENFFEEEIEVPIFSPEEKNIQYLAARCGKQLGEYQQLLHSDINTIHQKMIEYLPDFEKIPSEYIEAWVECDVRQKPQKEYALEKGIGLSAAKSRVQRAREKIKQVFMKCCTFEFDVRGSMIDFKPIQEKSICVSDYSC